MINPIKFIPIVCMILLADSVDLAAQTSDMKLDNSNANDIEVIQQGRDSSTNSKIDALQSDSNKVKVSQGIDTLAKTATDPKKDSWLDSMGNLIKIVVGVISIITATVGLVRYLRNRKRRKSLGGKG